MAAQRRVKKREREKVRGRREIQMRGCNSWDGVECNADVQKYRDGKKKEQPTVT